ncbi:MAG: hypothetical protein RLZZ292_2762 [Bacteroidota bacterium]|jgi:hypothetical protein
MKINFLFFILICLLVFAIYDPVKLYTTQSILNHLKSANKDSILIGAFNAQKRKDTLFIPLLLKHISDARISHHKYFYGISVHRGCIIALKEISDQEPPNAITDMDTVNINFYRNLLAKYCQ